jgi:transposase
MKRMAEGNRPVTGGVDTHADAHVAAVVDEVGRVLGTQSFPADKRGYHALATWMTRYGQLGAVGVEGTGSYGAGLARHLSGKGVEVIEVIRPSRQVRRRRGKSDPTDAEAAARAVLSGEACGAPKSRDGAVEALRALRVARQGAVKARTQAANQLRDLVVTAPEQLRARLRPLPTAERVALAARFRPGSLRDPLEATKAAMASLAPALRGALR